METQYPLAEEVARAVVAACRICGEDPIALIGGSKPSKARFYAFAALAHRFRTIQKIKIVGFLGLSGRKAFLTQACDIVRGRGRNGKWFNLADLNTVVAACGWPLMTAEDALLRRSAAPGRPVDIPAMGLRPESRAMAIGPVRIEDRAKEGASDLMSGVLEKDFAVLRRGPAQRIEASAFTAEFCGDPHPSRSALAQRQAEEAGRSKESQT